MKRGLVVAGGFLVISLLCGAIAGGLPWWALALDAWTAAVITGAVAA